jgi:imidazolonepropionase-like amidohydrolase
MFRTSPPLAAAIAALLVISTTSRAQPTTAPAGFLVVRGETVYTMAGEPIKDGIVIIRGEKIERVGGAADIQAPAGAQVLRAKVVTPGLIDAHTVIGLQGFRNEAREQDQLEKSAPVQPELRAADAFNGRERLLEYVRGFGVTTIHTGPQPGALVPGQTMIIKTRGPTVDDGLLSASAMLSITLGQEAIPEEKGKAPGTRAKQIAMLRAELIKAQEYDRKRTRATTRPATAPSGASAPATAAKTATSPTTQPSADAGEPPARDLRTEVFVRALHKELPVLVTAHRAQDILSALKLAKEFDLRLVLDGASEAYLMIEPIKAAGVPVVLHPTMYRSHGEAENLSFETAGKLRAAGIPVALQSGFEDYVPKTRVVLFEAALAASNGLTFEQALATITSDAAKILGVDARVGSLEAGKDADLALYDGDPFEYTTHCTATVIDGRVVSIEKH